MKIALRSALAAALYGSLLASTVAAQGTLDDYRRAAAVNRRFDGLVTGVVTGGVNWMGRTNQFWYRVSVTGGNQFVRVDATAGGAKQPAFDHARLAIALGAVTGGTHSALTLPFETFEYVDGGQAITFDAPLGGGGREVVAARFRCTLVDYVCQRTGEARGRGLGRGFTPPGPGARGAEPRARVSPDSAWEAFIQNHNVAVRRRGAPESRGREPGYALLSHDGSEGDAYQLGTIEWSPDSKKLVAYRRKPGYTRMVHYVRSSPTDQVQPKDTAIFYRKPGDVLDFNQPVIFDVVAGTQMVVKNDLFPNAYQITRPVWRSDSRAFTIQYNQRGHMVYRVLEVDAASGGVRRLIDEQTQSFFAYRPASANLRDAGKNFAFDVGAGCSLTGGGGAEICETYEGRELLWMSERDGWNHLYLYDGTTGKVKQQITKGEWVVKSVDSVDVANRQIYFRALGVNRGQDPYFVHFYRIGFDGRGLVAYTEADGTHELYWSPDRSHYVDVYSRVDLPTVTELRRVSDGAVIPLERGDMSAALAQGFRPPEVFVAKGRDGKTDIWGVIVRPVTFDENRRYPIIESIYAGPQGSFVPKTWGGGQSFLATAELGFVVVQIDGMGTNNRSKAFHDVAWKNLQDAGFPDRILWHRAANAKYPWYDISRVGVYGGSAGGQNAAGAVLFHGDFYDAAVASSGCHDNRMDKIWWNEHWMGEMGPHYEAASNVANAHRLKGRLFLAVGEMDTNVDPSSTMQVVDALIRAGKDFELLVVPNGGHGAMGPDGNRRRHDFFVRSLLGVDPPDWNAGVTISTSSDSPDADPLDAAPAYGFFDDPAHELPPYWWW